MDDKPLPLTSATVGVAERAALISTELSSIQDSCGHEASANDISSISDELAKLSTTLWHLHQAVSADPEQYTQSFNEDLAEIIKELKLVFEEISECCLELQKVDGGNSSVAWMFKKGRAHRLQKHLKALKTTLVVMRTVLWHGKDYGTQNSPGRLAESSPHTMHEDRVILESVIAQSRDAILDLHNLDESRKHNRNHSSSSSSHFGAGAHHRNLSASTGIEIPPIPDVLPAADSNDSPVDSSKPSRRFSKRGVRLGVHASILDAGAHDAPEGLKKKWVRQSRSNQVKMSGGLPSLGKISEIDSMISMPSLPADQLEQKVALKDVLAEGRRTPELDKITEEMEGHNGGSTPGSLATGDLERKKSVGSVKKMFRHFTLSHPGESKKDKDKENGGNGGNTLIRRLSILAGGHPSGALKTPDFEKEFENGRS